MATRRRRRPPPKKSRQAATQSRERDVLILRAERLYVSAVEELERDASKIVERWIAENSREAIRVADAGELRLLRNIRGLFDEPANLKRIFGRIAGEMDRNVLNLFEQLIPSLNRSKLVSPKSIERFTTRNAKLIGGLGDEATDRIAKFLRAGAEGRHTEALTKEFERAFDVTKSKARLWARDQTLKLHGQLTEERSLAVGIERYFWTDSNDERTRIIHRELGDRSDRGETFSYRDPPIIAEDPERRGNPGDDYQCRCTAFPVI